MLRQISSMITLISVVASLLLVSGCSSKRVLDSKSAATPSGVDISGYWQLRTDDADEEARRAAKSSEPFLVLSRSSRTQRIRRSRSSGGPSAHVFLELGKSLKITQTSFGMFISYDRSIVEEYTFGENRIVAIGPIEALRVSGWDASAFVVETMDKTGTVLFEAWHLQEDGEVLVRDIRMSNEDEVSFDLQQFYDRKLGSGS